MDELFTINCPKCAGVFPVLAWSETPVFGLLGDDRFQCPACRYAFGRVKCPSFDSWRGPEIRVIEMEPLF